MTSRMVTRLADLFGTSMPTADLPGVGASIRSGAAANASERSFGRAVMRFTCTPGPGWTSYWVTAGPGLTPTTLHSTPNVASVLSRILTLRLISSAIRSRRAVTVSSRAVDGSFHSISGRSSSGSATTRITGDLSAGTFASATATGTDTAVGATAGVASAGATSSSSSTSHTFFWSGAGGAV